MKSKRLPIIIIAILAILVIYLKIGNDSPQVSQTLTDQTISTIPAGNDGGNLNVTALESIETLAGQNQEQNTKLKVLQNTIDSLQAQINDDSQKSTKETQILNKLDVLEDQLSILQSYEYPAIEITAVQDGNDLKRSTTNQSQNQPEYTVVGVRVDSVAQITPEDSELFNFTNVSGSESKVISQETATETNTESPQSIPFFTLPVNDQLTHNVASGAIIGVVPNINNQVFNRIRFKLVSTKLGVLSEHQYPAGLKNIVWGGIALGVGSQSCLYGIVDSVTFVFTDGRILTASAQSNGVTSDLTGGVSIGSGFGYISNAWGERCLPGELISNSRDYVTDRAIVGGLEAATNVARQSNINTTIDNNGNSIENIDPNRAGNAAAAGFVGGVLNAYGEDLQRRIAQAFDLVYIKSGTPITIELTREISIDYPPTGRLTVYGKTAHENISPFDLD